MKFLSAIFCLLVIACSKDENGKSVSIGQIHSIESLKNISLGQSDTIVVTYGGGDGCAKPDHLDATVSGNSIVIKAYYSYPMKADVCPAVVPVHRLKYIYKPSSKGIYTYKSFNTEAGATTTVE